MRTVLVEEPWIGDITKAVSTQEVRMQRGWIEKRGRRGDRPVNRILHALATMSGSGTIVRLGLRGVEGDVWRTE